MKKIRVALADDHPIVGKGIVSELAYIPNIEIVFVAHSREELLQNIENHSLDVLILDVVMPGVSSTDLFKEVNKLHPALNMIAYTSLNSPILIKTLYKQEGVKGYVNKNDEIVDLLTAIEIVATSDIYISDKYLHLIASKYSDNLQVVSLREKEVLKLLMEQYTTKQIAERLFISVNTVESHRKNLFSKFEVENMAGLISEAIKQGYLH